jgi:hypothetical protein
MSAILYLLAGKEAFKLKPPRECPRFFVTAFDLAVTFDGEDRGLRLNVRFTAQHHPPSPSWRRAALGHEDQFPPSKLSSRLWLSEPTFAGTHGNW